MPLYEYKCNACSSRFERIRKFSDPPLEECPVCGKGPVEKLVSSPAFQFKGSGWYITDYARKSESGAAPSKSDKAETGEKAASSDKPDTGGGDTAAKPKETAPAEKAAPATATKDK